MTEKKIAVVLITDLSKVGSEIEKQLKKALAPAEKAGESIGKKLTKGFTKQTVAFTKSGHEMAKNFAHATGPIERAIANFSAGFSGTQVTGLGGQLGGAVRKSLTEAEKGLDGLSKAVDNTALRIGTGLGRGMLSMGKAGYKAFQHVSEGARLLSIAGLVVWQTYDGLLPRLRAVAKLGGLALRPLQVGFLAAQVRAINFSYSVAEAMGDGLRSVRKWGQELPGTISKAFQDGVASVKAFTSSLKQAWTDAGGFTGVMSALGQRMKDGFSAGVAALTSLRTNIGQAWKDIGGFRGAVSSLWNGLRTGASAAANAFGGVRAAAANAFNFLKTVATNGFNQMWQSAANASKGITNVFAQAFKGLTKLVPDLKLENIGKGIAAGFARLDSMDMLSSRLERITGSGQQAAKVISDLAQSASRFSFDQATVGNFGARLLEAGVSGQRLIPILETIGNVAAHTGKTTAAGFDEVGNAFLEMSRAGTVSEAHLESLSKLGINALDILAKQSGESAAEMSQRISNGALDSERAMEMLVQGLSEGSDSLAGSMDDLNNTVGGSFRKLKDAALAALGTLFAPLQGPISSGVDWVIEKLQRLPDFMAEMSALFGPAMSNLGAIFGPLAQQIGSALGTALGAAREALAALAPHFENFTAFLRDNKEIVALFAAAIGTFVVGLGLATGAIQLMTVANNLLRASFLGHPIGMLIAGVAALVAGLIYAYNNFEGFRNVVDAVWEGLMSAVEPVVSFFQETVWPLLVEGWNRLLEAAEPVVEAVKEFFAGMGEEGGAFAEKITEITDWIGERMTQLADIFQGVLDIIGALWSEHGDGIMATVQMYLGFVSALWSGVWTALVGVLSGVWTMIQGIIEGALGVIQGIINVFAGVLTGDWSRAWEGVKQIFSGAGTALLGLVQGFWQAIVGVFRGLGATLMGIWNSIWNAVRGPVSRAVTVVLNLVNGLKSKLFNAGKNVIRGLIDGLKSMISAVSNTMSNIAQTIRDKLPFSPAKDGPLRRYPPHRGGRNIARYLADGLARETRAVDRAALGLADTIHARVPASLEVRRHAASTGGAAAAQPTIQVVNHYPQAEPTSATVNRSLQYAAAIGVV
ncbi:tape measure protein [Nocardiopsis exhalans]|uniref:Tape measure protein n=1 Tax=Nocardiopsis exhalans TaxID=163604 RepID=A0ABY5D9V1_9ACTN|nr:tape measure protein [Nocardiopsis exhalans]USY21124.1 tape measure protein [Nocardiopsis exhalans]